MTQSHSAEKSLARCAGEPLWNISLLPVPRPSQPAAAPGGIVIELPLDLTIQEAVRRRNAA